MDSEPIARPMEEPVVEPDGDSPAARGAPRGLPRGRGRRPLNLGASRRGSLSQPPPESTRMDASDGDDFDTPRVSKVFHTISYG